MQSTGRQPSRGFGAEENKEFSEEQAVRLSTKSWKYCGKGGGKVLTNRAKGGRPE